MGSQEKNLTKILFNSKLIFAISFKNYGWFQENKDFRKKTNQMGLKIEFPAKKLFYPAFFE